MRVVDIIEAKRDAKAIDPKDMRDFVNAVASEKVPDYQTAAFLMAVFFRGMTEEELVAFTEAMIHSGDTMHFDALESQYKVDKHSTGGVGDKVSLSLAPMVAACGPVIPMISGRGLGHTGGTLDKLEAIAGYRVDLSNDEIQSAVKTAGYVITGQTARLVPADKKFYALRDVTGTVASIPLIAASIMSKKMSVGLNGLVLDVKTGSGAFMKTEAMARELADTMISIGNAMNCTTRACITSMDQPLGRAVGNANEVIEAIDMLKGQGPKDYAEICYAIGAEMLMVAKKLSHKEAMAELENAVKSGAALEQMRKNIQAQGGNPAVIDNYNLLSLAKYNTDFCVEQNGYIASFDCEAVGKAACVLGGGREVAGQAIDHSVGIEVLHKIGDRLHFNDPLFKITYQDEDKLQKAKAILKDAFVMSEEKVAAPALIRDRRA
ncbi:MAG: thymidine phosphorylase [Bradymonadales bacterium]|jgi:pyrimidine-nucleoside phosphorylase